MPYKDRETYLSTQRSYYKKDPDTYKWRSRTSKYGVSKDFLMDLLIKQDNKCALCKKSFNGFGKLELQVDHCHETNEIRGLLCMPCNVGLGMLGDNEEGLTRALQYIKGERS